jgi:hypothetical protein
MNSIDRLVEQPLWEYKPDLFLDAANEAYSIWRQNPRYDSLCLGLNSPKSFRELEDILKAPGITQQIFKDDPEIMKTGEQVGIRYIESSGTTIGRFSNVPRNPETWHRLEKNYEKLNQDIGPLVYMAMLAPDPTLEGVPQKAVFIYADLGTGKTAHDHFIKYKGVRTEIVEGIEVKRLDMEMDVPGLFGKLREHPGRKFIFGVPGLIHRLYHEGMEPRNISVDLENGILATAGGPKDLQGGNISMSELVTIAEKGFNAGHVDWYASAEMMFATRKGPKCTPEKKHIPAQGYIFTIDWDKLDKENVIELTKPNEPGLAVIVDPMNTTTPGITIMDDIVKVDQNYKCPCGIKGPVMEFVGRTKDADEKTRDTCGRTMARDTKLLKMNPDEILKALENIR